MQQTWRIFPSELNSFTCFNGLKRVCVELKWSLQVLVRMFVAVWTVKVEGFTLGQGRSYKWWPVSRRYWNMMTALISKYRDTFDQNPVWDLRYSTTGFYRSSILPERKKKKKNRIIKSKYTVPSWREKWQENCQRLFRYKKDQFNTYSSVEMSKKSDCVRFKIIIITTLLINKKYSQKYDMKQNLN